MKYFYYALGVIESKHSYPIPIHRRKRVGMGLGRPIPKMGLHGGWELEILIGKLETFERVKSVVKIIASGEMKVISSIFILAKIWPRFDFIPGKKFFSVVHKIYLSSMLVKCGLWTSSISVIWELVINAELQGPLLRSTH